MGRWGIVVTLLGLVCAHGASAEDPLLDELHGLRSAQDAEIARLNAFEEKLPFLSYAQSLIYAEKLGRRLKGHVEALTKLPIGEARQAHAEQARTLLETAALLSVRIDSNDRTEERMKAHIARVERARRPVKVLFFVANMINVAADLARSGGRVDPISLVEDAQMDPYEVRPNQWEEVFAQEFLSAVLVNMGLGPDSVPMLTGMEGALKAQQVLDAILTQQGCKLLLTSR